MLKQFQEEMEDCSLMAKAILRAFNEKIAKTKAELMSAIV